MASFQTCDLLLMKMLVSIVMIMTDVLYIDKTPKCNKNSTTQIMLPTPVHQTTIHVERTLFVVLALIKK